jgi:hypothetical protein
MNNMRDGIVNEKVRGFMKIGFKKFYSILHGRRGYTGQGLVGFAIALPIVLTLIMALWSLVGL